METAGFTPGVTIGKGFFASVNLARRESDGLLVAVKRASKRGKYGKFAQLERDALVQCQGHPFIPKVFCAFQTATTLDIALEFLIGGACLTEPFLALSHRPTRFARVRNLEPAHHPSKFAP